MKIAPLKTRDCVKLYQQHFQAGECKSDAANEKEKKKKVEEEFSSRWDSQLCLIIKLRLEPRTFSHEIPTSDVPVRLTRLFIKRLNLSPS